LKRDAFVETQTAFQLGTLDVHRGADPREIARTEARGRVNLIFHNPADQTFVPEDRGTEIMRTGTSEWTEIDKGQSQKPLHKIRAQRNARTLNQLYAAGLRVPVIIDMQDAVRHANPGFPAFQYVRMSGEPNSILWPHWRVHKIGASEFCAAPDPTEPGLETKKPIVFWRGSLRGFSTFGGQMTNFRHVVRQFLAGEVDKATLLAHLETVPRYVFVSRYFGTEGFDIGFCQPESLKEYLQIPEIARFERPFAGIDVQRQCKYLVSIQGTDVGSSFGWQLGTNSVILREDYPWEVFFDCHFRPGTDYVAVAPDFSNVQERIAWCEANQDACAAMIEKRHAGVQFLLKPVLRKEILQRVIGEYTTRYNSWAT
jgi:hypothetical protein